MSAKPHNKPRLPSQVNRPAGAKSGLSARAREIIERTRRARKARP